MMIASGLLVVAGLGGLALHGKSRTEVAAGDCAGGQLAGQPLPVASEHTPQLPADASDLAAPA
jgi:hypothetical protein